MNLAMERGEIDGRGTSNPNGMFTGGGTTGADGRPLFNFLLQWGLTKQRDYTRVPLLSELATTDDQRLIFDFVCKVASLARPVATNTDVPPERVAALRRAFEATLADDDFRAEAARMGAEISLQRGEELQQLVTDIVNAPPTVLEKVRQAVR
jgi:hypothetical protein